MKIYVKNAFLIFASALVLFLAIVGLIARIGGYQ